MTVGPALWPEQLTDTERGQLNPGIPAALDRRPDILVVGGGMVGVATALACQQAGLGSVALLERDSLGAGASGGVTFLVIAGSNGDSTYNVNNTSDPCGDSCEPTLVTDVLWANRERRPALLSIDRGQGRSVRPTRSSPNLS